MTAGEQAVLGEEKVAMVGRREADSAAAGAAAVRGQRAVGVVEVKGSREMGAVAVQD